MLWLKYSLLPVSSRLHVKSTKGMNKSTCSFLQGFITCLIFTSFLKVYFDGSASAKFPVKANHKTNVAEKVYQVADQFAPVINEEGCLWDQSVRKEVTPKIKLDPTKFLYPGFRYGPNNQLRQLLKTIHVAILLNRTVVLPNFFSAFAFDEQKIPPYQRIDVDRVCRLVSCVSLERFQKVCNGTFDYVFLEQNFRRVDYKKVSQSTGMTAWFRPQITAKNKQLGSVVGPATIFPEKRLSSSEIKQYFDVPKPCALYPGHDDDLSFRGLKHSLPLPDVVADPSLLEENTLKFAIVDAVGALPPVIGQVAEAYAQRVFKGGIHVGVHWRYDDCDWARHCMLSNDSTCENFLKITEKDVATAIHADLQTVMPKFTQEINIYIATPPIMKNYAHGIIAHLKRLNSAFRNASLSLDHFINSTVDSCFRKNNWNLADTVSLVEMALMQRSEHFYYSKLSTWSMNCQMKRWFVPRDGRPPIMKYEASIFDLSEAVLLSRLNDNIE